MPTLLSQDRIIQTECAEEDLSRLRLVLKAALALDTDSEPPPPDQVQAVPAEAREAVPGYKLASGSPYPLSAADCRYLATRLYVFLERILEQPAPDATEEQIRDARARQGEFLGASYSFSDLEAVTEEELAAQVRPFVDAIGNASEHGGLTILP